MQTVNFRSNITSDDYLKISAIAYDPEFFTSQETFIIKELLADSFIKKNMSDYKFIIAETQGEDDPKFLGFICYGFIEGTEGSYDLYWIIIKKEHRKTGVGRLLVDYLVNLLKLKGARKLIVETSSKECYLPTRRFYSSVLFNKVAVVPDFYRPLDDKIIYVRDINN